MDAKTGLGKDPRSSKRQSHTSHINNGEASELFHSVVHFLTCRRQGLDIERHNLSAALKVLHWLKHLKLEKNQVKHRFLRNTMLPINILLFLSTCALATHGLCVSMSTDFTSDNSNISRPITDRLVTKAVSTNRNGGRSQTFYLDNTQYTPSAAKNTDKIVVKSNNDSIKPKSSSHHLYNLSARIKSIIRSTFLPINFPNSTPPGYLRYCTWSWTQDLTTQLRAVLATQRVLQGVGVGRADATALSAILQFLIRDGCGMAASLIFTSAAASKFRSNVKKWRILADLMIDVGITLEVAATQCPPFLFLPMISVGNMCKAICGVAAGASGGAINLHWSKLSGDISDVQAKFNAQNTVTGSVGLVFAALFARSLADVNLVKLWTLYGFLTVLHIYANIQCMRLVAFNTLNNSRIDMVLSQFVQGATELPTPVDVAAKESLLFLPRKTVLQRQCVPIMFGVPFDGLVQQSKGYVLDSIDRDAPYWIRKGCKGTGQPCVLVALSSTASPENILKAYFTAFILSRDLYKASESDMQTPMLSNDMEEQWQKFVTLCKSAGWKLDGTELSSQGFEVSLH